MRLVARLKTFELWFLTKLSLRSCFQPDTRSQPSSRRAISCGISAGSSCRSASMVMT